MQQLRFFTADVLPALTAEVADLVSGNKKKVRTSSGQRKKKEKKPQSKKNGTVPVGTQIAKRYPEISNLSEKMDFKARMIPILFLATEAKLEDTFTIRDIQVIMRDAIGEYPDKKQVEDVLSRRADWFERVNQNPRKYKLLSIAKDYARNILAE